MSSDRIPKATRHSTGQAVVRLNGKDFYLGKYGSAPAKAGYEALIARWLANGRCLPDETGRMSINSVILAYLKFAEGYYPPDGAITSEVRCIKDAVRPLKELFGRTHADEFGPKKLKTVRQRMIDCDWSRSYINHQTNRIKRLFKWAASEELLPAEVFHGLQSLSGLRKGMTNVREAKGVKPVAEAIVEATLAFMCPALSTMVQLQLLTGCRPGEVCVLRTCDVETSGSVWLFRPAKHKTEHHGKDRVIMIGPKGQALLRPWLKTDLTAYVFSPALAEEERNMVRRKARKSPMTPSQAKRSKKKHRARPFGDRYTSQSYARAIARACEKADAKAHADNPALAAELVVVPTWTPNQLRHTRATQLRKEHGLEAVKIILGHSSVETSLLYAERDLAKATKIMESAG